MWKASWRREGLRDEELGDVVGKGDPGRGNSMQGKKEEKNCLVLCFRSSRGSSIQPRPRGQSGIRSVSKGTGEPWELSSCRGIWVGSCSRKSPTRVPSWVTAGDRRGWGLEQELGGASLSTDLQYMCPQGLAQHLSGPVLAFSEEMLGESQ